MSREMSPRHRIPDRRRLGALAATLVIAGLPVLASCGHSPTGGSSPVTTTGGPPIPTGHAYHGPLYVPVEHPRKTPKPERYGAAGRVIDCRTTVGLTGGLSTGPGYDGETADTADGALRLDTADTLPGLSAEEYRLAAHTKTRALFTYMVEGVVKRAVVVRDGPTLTGRGWHTESWARCDWSEFPADVTAPSGMQIWRDASGRPAPTPRIVSYVGPEHCNWQSMTFLQFGKATYVRRPSAELKDFFAERYRADLKLPAGAHDTGYHRGHDHLWTSPDEQRAYVGSRTHVELWPRTVKPLGCA